MTRRPDVMDLTLDVCILMSGSNRGNLCHPRECRDLMKRVESHDACMLALDEKGRIAYQYGKMLKEGTFGHHWLVRLLVNDKVKRVRQLHLNRGVVTALKEAHFDSARREDFKYVETAGATDCRVLVSHDPDYSAKVCRILRKRLDVVVHDAPGCLSWAEALAEESGSS